MGLGVGAILPSLNTLVAEFAPSQRREFSVTVMQAGFPAGGILGGLVAVAVIASVGWRGIFWSGAGLTAVALLIAWRLLPESPEFLIRRQPAGALLQLNQIRSRLGQAALDQLPDRAAESPSAEVHGYRGVLHNGVWLRVLLLALAFFFVMASFYFVMNWTPKLLIDAGLQLTAGLSGGIVLSGGGIVGGLLLGWFAARYGVRPLTIGFMLATAPAMLLFSQTQALGAMLGTGLVLGFLINGSMMGLYALTPGLFDAATRATATGIGVGLGRLGAIAGPFVAGYLVAAQWSMPAMYAVFGLPLVLSALTLWILHRRMRHSLA